MLISIDTEKINTMASLVQSANTEIDLCVTSMIPVVEHNDWNCKERDMINEGILSVKTNMKILQETIDAFSSMMKQVSSMFDAFEAAVPSKYQHIDTLLGSMFSVDCGEHVTNVSSGGVTSEVAGAMAAGVRVSGGLENNVLGNLTEPLQVCNFADVDFGNLD